MLVATFFALTVFVFLAIAGGIIGIILESRQRPAASPGRNPAARDTIYPIIGWGSLFALYFALEFVGAQNLTPEFKTQLGTLVVLPFFYAVLSTARLIWRSARRIDARLRHCEPVAWRAIPFLDRLAFPVVFLSAIFAAGAMLVQEGLSLNALLLSSVAVMLAFVRKQRAQ
jgi:hypothetical protein